MSGLLIAILRLYQLSIGRTLGQRCRFYPSCSSYAIGAIRLNGPLLGSGQAMWRLVRCGPWTAGGVDDPLQATRRRRLRRFGMGS
ncbi:MAG: membrane protein insertion efficiency factor YidD [Acidobacteria bacterium]|nr:membrane protein insertion efficiency factor YidD [Acidobacteriota bacterium]